MAPILFNLYNNDQTKLEIKDTFYMRRTWKLLPRVYILIKVQDKLVRTLKSMNKYYINNHLKPNPNKTQVCCFHLRNKDV